MIEQLAEYYSDPTLIGYKKDRWIPSKLGEVLHKTVQLYEPLVVFESGTCNGFSTMYLAAGLNKGYVFTFDPRNLKKVWKDLRTPEGKPVIERIFYCQAPFSRGLSSVVFDSLINLPKLFFIDGNHKEGPVQAEISAIQLFCQSGDVIIFDDYGPSEFLPWKAKTYNPSPGVAAAVDESFQSLDWKKLQIDRFMILEKE